LDLRALPVTRLRVSLVAARAWEPPAHLGDMLRRALVSGVYAAVPSRHHADLLGGWFDDRTGAQRARPYALQVERPESVSPDIALVMGLTLVGVVPEPAALIAGIRQMATKGLGPDRVAHQVQAIDAEGAVSGPVDIDTCHGFPPPARLSDLLRRPPGPVRGVDVCFQTPFTPGPWRHGRPESLALGPTLLFDACIGRLRGIQRSLGLERQTDWRPPRAWEQACDLRWTEASVQSRRKTKPDRLGGVEGRVALSGELHGLGPLLAMAEVLQFGRATSRGHGVVSLEWRDEGGVA